MGLGKDDIDFKHSCIHVSHQIQEAKGGGFYVSSPKSKSGIRDIPMLENVAQLLQEAITFSERKKQFEIDGYSGFVFVTDAGSIKYHTQYNYELDSCIRRYNSSHEDQLPHVNVHCLRHSFCTTMAELGIDPKPLQYLMGHSTIEMTMNHYRQVSYDDIQRSVAELANKETSQRESYTNFAKNMRNYDKF